MSKIDLLVSPRFDKESGARLKTVRMKMLMDQASLGKLLGMSQQQVAKLEQGHISTAPFTLAVFKATFGNLYSYILTGAGADKVNVNQAHKTYWNTRLKKNRKPGSGLWKKQEQIEGETENS